MSKRLPLEIRRMASSLFAGHSGFSGPEIFEWFGQFCNEIGEYPWEGAPSRWMMFERCLGRFPIERQCGLLLKLLDYRGPMKYGRPTEEERSQLRELVLNFAGTLEGTKSILATTSWESVRDAWTKALERAPSDPEGAITAARATLESVCKHILDASSATYRDDGNLVKLYKATAKLLRLSPDGYTEEIFRQVLGGCAGVVAGLAGLRNVYGDSHGKTKLHPKPRLRHARLAINAAMIMAEFLIETYEAREERRSECT